MSDGIELVRETCRATIGGDGRVQAVFNADQWQSSATIVGVRWFWRGHVGGAYTESPHEFRNAEPACEVTFKMRHVGGTRPA